MLPGQHNTAEPSTTAEEETLTNQNKTGGTDGLFKGVLPLKHLL